MTTTAPRPAQLPAHRGAVASRHGAATALHVAAMTVMLWAMLPPHDAARCLLAIAVLVALAVVCAIGVRRGRMPIAHLLDGLAMLAAMAAPLVVGVAHHGGAGAAPPATAIVAVGVLWGAARIATGLHGRADAVFAASTVLGLGGMIALS